jgi:hypothetical protein
MILSSGVQITTRQTQVKFKLGEQELKQLASLASVFSLSCIDAFSANPEVLFDLASKNSLYNLPVWQGPGKTCPRP